LIVDDENVVRDSLGKWFEEEGYSVDTANSAREALLKLPRQRWDLALVDIKMPGMDGLELHRKIREVDPDIIVIIMTGYASVETAVQALKDGAYDYIMKPFDPDDLAHAVAKASSIAARGRKTCAYARPWRKRRRSIWWARASPCNGCWKASAPWRPMTPPCSFTVKAVRGRNWWPAPSTI